MNDSKFVIIFHRSKQNSEEDLINQKAFLEANRDIIGSAKVIDYMSSDYPETSKVFEVFKSIDFSKKVIVIMNSFLSKKDYDLKYNLYFYLRSMKTIDMVSEIYLMDHEGRLYKEVGTIEKL